VSIAGLLTAFAFLIAALCISFALVAAVPS